MGPLVVALTAWRVPPHPSAGQPEYLENLLRPHVRRCDRPTTDPHALCIDDSKKVYRSRGELDRLEQGALALLVLAGFTGNDLTSLLEFVDIRADKSWSELPWLKEIPVAVPACVDISVPSRSASTLGDTMLRRGVVLRRCRCRVLPELEFNATIERWGSKAMLVAHAMCELLSEVLPDVDCELYVYTDRQGGRVYYREIINLLQDYGDEKGWEVVSESPQLSRYARRTASDYWRWDFVRKGEEIFAVAAASMIAKYIRELVMLAFNAFWQREIPELRPTAGYPKDAKRFKQQISKRQCELNIPDRWLWRTR